MPEYKPTLEFHPQAKEVKKALKDAADTRAKKYSSLYQELKIDTKESIAPRPFIYCLPTGNTDFDNGIDYATPNKSGGYPVNGGGFPVGKITVIHGRSGVGKSQFVYNLCCNAPFRTLYIDTEGGIIDVMADNCIVYCTYIVEDCWQMVTKAISSGHFNCVVIDSLTNLKTREDIQKDDGDMPRMGQKAQVIGQFLSKLVAMLMTHDVAVVIVSQERESFDLFKKDPVLPGGAAIMYEVELILGLYSNKADIIKDKETGLKIGQKTKVKLRKNRLGPDGCEFVCKLMFAKPQELGDKL